MIIFGRARISAACHPSSPAAVFFFVFFAALTNSVKVVGCIKNVGLCFPNGFSPRRLVISLSFASGRGACICCHASAMWFAMVCG